MNEALPAGDEARIWAAAEEATRFFMGEADVQQATTRSSVVATSRSPRGSRGLRDVMNDVAIDVVLAGDYPGDGKPKPVAFPDPSEATVRGRRVALLPLPTLLELKLASGMSAPHRLKDLADVLEVIRALDLPRDLGQQLDASVRDKYDELWRAAQARDPE